MDKKSILEEMIYYEDEEFEKLVPKAKQVVKVKNTGEPVLLHRDKLTNAEKIGCYILGKFFSKELGFVDNPSSTIDEISNVLKIDKNIFRARLSDLNDQEIVERFSRGEYKISLIKLENYLDGIINKIETNKEV